MPATPHQFISNLNSQRTAEILYNMALAFYRDGKYFDAFVNFEKASHLLKANPKLWYYMGLCVLHYNKQQQRASQLENEGFASKFGYNEPGFERRP